MDPTLTLIILHILTGLAALFAIITGIKGFMPKSVSEDVKLLKQEVKHIKDGTKKLEQKLDRIDDYLRGG